MISLKEAIEIFYNKFPNCYLTCCKSTKKCYLMYEISNKRIIHTAYDIPCGGPGVIVVDRNSGDIYGKDESEFYNETLNTEFIDDLITEENLRFNNNLKKVRKEFNDYVERNAREV